MPSLTISGIPIDFPYDPYPCQINYMEKVIECLSNGFNGVLESPTGTGKTLCLLCAAMAWLQVRKVELMNANNRAMNSQPPEDGFYKGGVKIRAKPQPGTDGKPTSGQQPQGQPVDWFQSIRVIYTSRTHSQLAQVISELNKTIYRKNVRVCTIGSRDQMCIDPEVQSEPNSVLKNHACRAKVAARTCRFYNNMEKNISTLISRLQDKVPDIEDLVTYGKNNTCCPYYLARESQQEAELILMPYNYILDPAIRKLNKVELSGSVIIFDEAHNLHKICEESVSMSLSTKDIAMCLKEATDTLDLINKETEAIRAEMDESEVPFGQAEVDRAPTERIKPKELAHLILLLQALEKQFEGLGTELTGPGGSDALPGRVREGEFLLRLLQDAGFQSTMLYPVSLLIDNIVNYLSVKHANNSWSSKGVNLKKLASLIGAAYGNMDQFVDTEWMNSTNPKDNTSKHFKTYICKDETPALRGGGNQVALGSSQSLWYSKPAAPPTASDAGILLNYWCFCAGPGMQSLARQGVHSLIVTSGTLAPLDGFVGEMQIPFQVRLENRHVIDSSQVLPIVISGGPSGQAICGTFRNRGKAYDTALFHAILNLCRLVPQGCLIFFGSYSQMSACMETWNDQNLMDRLRSIKPVFVEERNRNRFAAQLEEFKEAAGRPDGKGAVFMGVCRGKISEGVDFADNQCRAVIIAGIPFPPVKDPKVVLKKRYLDEHKGTTSNSLSGDGWYRLEAVRAVNQAIGRAIRHKDDFGAIILLDERFATWPAASFPNWIAPHMVAFDRNAFGRGLRSVSSFYNAQKGLIRSVTKALPSGSESAFQISEGVIHQKVTHLQRLRDGEIQARKSMDQTSSTTIGVNDVIDLVNTSHGTPESPAITTPPVPKRRRDQAAETVAIADAPFTSSHPAPSASSQQSMFRLLDRLDEESKFTPSTSAAVSALPRYLAAKDSPNQFGIKRSASEPSPNESFTSHLTKQTSGTTASSSNAVPFNLSQFMKQGNQKAKVKIAPLAGFAETGESNKPNYSRFNSVQPPADIIQISDPPPSRPGRTKSKELCRRIRDKIKREAPEAMPQLHAALKNFNEDKNVDEFCAVAAALMLPSHPQILLIDLATFIPQELEHQYKTTCAKLVAGRNK